MVRENEANAAGEYKMRLSCLKFITEKNLFRYNYPETLPIFIYLVLEDIL